MRVLGVPSVTVRFPIPNRLPSYPADIEVTVVAKLGQHRLEFLAADDKFQLPRSAGCREPDFRTRTSRGRFDDAHRSLVVAVSLTTEGR